METNIPKVFIIVVNKRVVVQKLISNDRFSHLLIALAQLNLFRANLLLEHIVLEPSEGINANEVFDIRVQRTLKNMVVNF